MQPSRSSRTARAGRIIVAIGIAMAVPGSGALAADKQPGSDKIPITTSSPQARELYLKGRDLAEKLRGPDARKLYEQALAKDPSFALAVVGMANTAPGNQEFFAAVNRAVPLAAKVSEGERLIVLGLEAGAKGDVPKQKELYQELARTYPNDERAHNTLAGLLFAQLDYDGAIAEYQKAIAINPRFSQPYNQLGYAYRFLGKLEDAEKTFKKYIELIPDDPNPYDSYAELLMKMGRFEESIKSYEKALTVDPKFVASFIGIGHDQIFLGRGAEARKAFARLAAVARNVAEKRQANFWTAVSWVYEGATDKALAELQKNLAIAEAAHDLTTQAGDVNVMANILLEAGRADEAAAKYRQQLELSGKSDAPEGVKENVRRNALANQTRVALAKKDLADAKAQIAAYAEKVAVKKLPFEVRQVHELQGMIALEEKAYDKAATELAQANQQDPRVLYYLALALQGKGDGEHARATARAAATFNGLNANYAFVRQKALELLGKS
jgi:tetratricopeptide (TPR) repeat protein